MADSALAKKLRSSRMTFVVRDREYGYTVCELCIDGRARTVACSCVC